MPESFGAARNPDLNLSLRGYEPTSASLELVTYDGDVDPAAPQLSTLLALYQRLDAAGRSRLPAVRSGQAVGLARTAEVDVAIRDSGTFMDPRSRRDW
jgi:hypothetical protein